MSGTGRTAVALAGCLAAIAALFGRPAAGDPVVTGRRSATTPVSVALDVSPPSGSDADVFTATVRVETPGASGVDRYEPPAFADFTVVDQQSRRATTEGRGGQGGQVTVELHTYLIAPQRIGKLATGRARVWFDGDAYASGDRVIGVASGLDGSAGRQQPAGPPGRQFIDPTARGGVGSPGFQPPVLASDEPPPAMFLHVAVSPARALVGEQITVTWLLYTRDEILRFEPGMPRLDDFWSETLYEPKAYYRYHGDVVGGVSYQLAVVSKRALFPLRAGTLTIGPYTARVASLYTPLGKASELASDPVDVEVTPLPDGAPPGFDSTYIGQFAIDAEVDRQRIEAGESLTLSVTVRGRGAIRRTNPPRLDVPGFSLRAPRDFDERVDPSTSVVSGERVYRYWTTPAPGSTGQQTIDPIILDYFDPRSRSYRQASSRPITIEVVGDVDRPPAGPGVDNVIARDIRLLHTDATLLDDSGRAGTSNAVRAYRSPWFWLLSALPLVGYLAVVVVTRGRRRGSAKGPKTGWAARRELRRRFRVAGLHRRTGRRGPFFAELSRLLIDAVERRVAAPVGALTRDQLTTLLAARGVSGAIIALVERELDGCDFARFAPDGGDLDLDAAEARVSALIAELDADAPRDAGSVEREP